MSGLGETTDSTFAEDVLQADMPTLVDFWAEWCAPCRTMNPLLERLAEEEIGRLRVVKMDVQANPETPERHSVFSIPTLILFVSGEAKMTINGFAPIGKIKQEIAPHLGD